MSMSRSSTRFNRRIWRRSAITAPSEPTGRPADDTGRWRVRWDRGTRPETVPPGTRFRTACRPVPSRRHRRREIPKDGLSPPDPNRIRIGVGSRSPGRSRSVGRYVRPSHRLRQLRCVAEDGCSPRLAGSFTRADARLRRALGHGRDGRRIAGTSRSKILPLVFPAACAAWLSNRLNHTRRLAARQVVITSSARRTPPGSPP